MCRGLRALMDLFNQQAGHCTTRQAAQRGVSRRVLAHHARACCLERVRRGVYRLAVRPPGRVDAVVVACLWAGAPVAASHETALAVHGVIDVLHEPIHVTVAHPFAGRDDGIAVHRRRLPAAEWQRAGAVAVTTLERTVDDLARLRGPAATLPLVAATLEREQMTLDDVRRLAMRSAHVSAAVMPLLLGGGRPTRRAGAGVAFTRA